MHIIFNYRIYDIPYVILHLQDSIVLSSTTDILTYWTPPVELHHMMLYNWFSIIYDTPNSKWSKSAGMAVIQFCDSPHSVIQQTR